MKKILIIGAASRITQHCARLWEEASADFTPGSREVARLELLAADLCVRSPSAAVSTATLDFDDAAASAALATRIDEATGALDVVLVANGSLPDQARCQDDLLASATAQRLNSFSSQPVAEAFAARVARRNAGSLAVIGSVTGDRGRKSNYAYGTAKTLVATCLEGLQRRFAASGAKAVLVKLGPTDPPMAVHLKGGRLASVATVVRRDIVAGKPLAYVLGKWWLIRVVIRHLPRFVFNKVAI